MFFMGNEAPFKCFFLLNIFLSANKLSEDRLCTPYFIIIVAIINRSLKASKTDFYSNKPW